MKLIYKLALGLFIVLVFIGSFIFYGLNLMTIEDKYGDYQELYYKIDKSNNYFIIIDSKEVGFVEKLEKEIYVSKNECLKHILNYSNSKIQVYEFEVNQTYSDFTLNDAQKLIKIKNAKLIFNK